jgi:hypothetical protein
MTEPVEDVDAIAAALRADTADLEVYADVLTSSLAEALPAEMVTVERNRSLGDRVSGRSGAVRRILVHLGDWELTLSRHGRGALVAQARQKVRGVVISNREVPVDEWVHLLAAGLARRAKESAAARAALARLLGQS